MPRRRPHQHHRREGVPRVIQTNEELMIARHARTVLGETTHA